MTQITYENAGVSREVSENAKDSIKAFAKATHSKNVLKEIGLFSGFYDPDFKKFKRPILVSSIDGVGTKVKISEKPGDIIDQATAGNMGNAMQTFQVFDFSHQPMI